MNEQATEMRQPVVWLINEGGHNYEDATRFGRIMPVTSGSVNPFNTDRLMVHISSRLRHASEEDFVLVSGLPILVGLFMCMWLIRFPKINLLQWSTRERSYEIRTVDRASVERLALDE